jgi:ribosome-binding protein aMBF1 (putative translation factor)
MNRREPYVPPRQPFVIPRSHEGARDGGEYGPAQEDEGLRIIGRLVFEERRRAGMSQRVLERETGVDQTTISRLERGLMPGMRIARLGSILAAFAGFDRYGDGHGRRATGDLTNRD